MAKQRKENVMLRIFSLIVPRMIVLVMFSFFAFRWTPTQEGKAITAVALLVYGYTFLNLKHDLGIDQAGNPMSVDNLPSGEKISILFGCTSKGEYPYTNHYFIEREDGRHQFIKTGDTLKPGSAMVVLNNDKNILVPLHENNQPF